MKNKRVGRKGALGNAYPITSYKPKSALRKPIKNAMIKIEKSLSNIAGLRDKYLHPLSTGKKIHKIALKQLSQARRNQIKKDYGVKKI